MKLRYKIAGGFLTILVVATASLGIVLSHNSACGAVPETAAGAELMSAITYRCYGPSNVLEFAKVEKPQPGENEVLVKVIAASVNPLDWHYMKGSPYVMRLMTGVGAPTETGMGVDFSGIVESVGRNVTRFRPGDEVFGGATGAFAEYVTIAEDRAVTIKPPNVTFEQAASVPIAALTALQALRDSGKLRSGQKVLINGASGGVGTFAIQIAKSFGAEVTGVCSTRNVQMVRSLGADYVLDYTREDYTQGGKQYDLIVDMVSNHSLKDNKRALKPEGILIIVGGGKGNWLGPMIKPLKAFLMSPFVSQEIVMILAQLRASDLKILADLMQSGKVRSMIDRRYSLSEVPAALQYSEKGHARGKIVINVE